MGVYCYECGEDACGCNLPPLHCQCKPLCFTCYMLHDQTMTDDVNGDQVLAPGRVLPKDSASRPVTYEEEE